MKPILRRFGGQAKRGKVCVFPPVSLLVTRHAKSATVHGVLSEAWPVAPRVNMVRRNRAIGDAAILTRIAGPSLDTLSPLGSCRPDSLRANALFPVRVGGRIGAPVFVTASAGAILASAATNAIGGHPERCAASLAFAINLSADADVLTRHGAEAAGICGSTAKRCVTDSASPNRLVGVTDTHASLGAELCTPLDAPFAASDAIRLWETSHGDATATARAVGAPIADIGRPANRTGIGVVIHAPIIPQTLK